MLLKHNKDCAESTDVRGKTPERNKSYNLKQQDWRNPKQKEHKQDKDQHHKTKNITEKRYSKADSHKQAGNQKQANNQKNKKKQKPDLLDIVLADGVKNIKLQISQNFRPFNCMLIAETASKDTYDFNVASDPYMAKMESNKFLLTRASLNKGSYFTLQCQDTNYKNLYCLGIQFNPSFSFCALLPILLKIMDIPSLFSLINMFDDQADEAQKLSIYNAVKQTLTNMAENWLSTLDMSNQSITDIRSFLAIYEKQDSGNILLPAAPKLDEVKKLYDKLKIRYKIIDYVLNTGTTIEFDQSELMVYVIKNDNSEAYHTYIMIGMIHLDSPTDMIRHVDLQDLAMCYDQQNYTLQLYSPHSKNHITTKDFVINAPSTIYVAHKDAATITTGAHAIGHLRLQERDKPIKQDKSNNKGDDNQPQEDRDSNEDQQNHRDDRLLQQLNKQYKDQKKADNKPETPQQKLMKIIGYQVVPHLTDREIYYNEDLVRWTEQKIRGNDFLQRVSTKIRDWVCRVNHHHDNYTIRTLPNVQDAIHVLDKLTRIRFNTQSYRVVHQIPSSITQNKEIMTQLQELFQLNNQQYSLFIQAMENGALPLSNLINSCLIKLGGKNGLKVYHHPYERLVTDALTADLFFQMHLHIEKTYPTAYTSVAGKKTTQVIVEKKTIPKEQVPLQITEELEQLSDMELSELFLKGEDIGDLTDVERVKRIIYLAKTRDSARFNMAVKTYVEEDQMTIAQWLLQAQEQADENNKLDFKDGNQMQNNDDVKNEVNNTTNSQEQNTQLGQSVHINESSDVNIIPQEEAQSISYEEQQQQKLIDQQITAQQPQDTAQDTSQLQQNLIENNDDNDRQHTPQQTLSQISNEIYIPEQDPQFPQTNVSESESSFEPERDSSQSYCVMDIGSKWKKMIDMITERGLRVTHLIAIRPIISNNDDTYVRSQLSQQQYHTYIQTKQVIFQYKGILVIVKNIALNANISLQSLVFDKIPINFISIIDAHYYDGVKDFLQTNIPKMDKNIEVWAVSNAYKQITTKDTTYSNTLYSGNGSYTLNLQNGRWTVTSTMEGNPDDYQHDILNIDGMNPKTTTDKNLSYVVKKYTAIAVDVRTVLYQIKQRIEVKLSEVSQTQIIISQNIDSFLIKNPNVINDKMKSNLISNVAAYISKQEELPANVTMEEVTNLMPQKIEQHNIAQELAATKKIGQILAIKYNDTRFKQITDINHIPLIIGDEAYDEGYTRRITYASVAIFVLLLSCYNFITYFTILPRIETLDEQYIKTTLRIIYVLIVYHTAGIKPKYLIPEKRRCIYEFVKEQTNDFNIQIKVQQILEQTPPLEFEWDDKSRMDVWKTKMTNFIILQYLIFKLILVTLIVITLSHFLFHILPNTEILIVSLAIMLISHNTQSSWVKFHNLNVDASKGKLDADKYANLLVVKLMSLIDNTKQFVSRTSSDITQIFTPVNQIFTPIRQRSNNESEYHLMTNVQVAGQTVQLQQDKGASTYIQFIEETDLQSDTKTGYYTSDQWVQQIKDEKVQILPLEEYTAKYSEKRKAPSVNNKVDEITVYDLKGEKHYYCNETANNAFKHMLQLAKQADNDVQIKNKQYIQNPGLPVQEVQLPLAYAEMNNEMIIETVTHRMLGCQAVPDSNMKKEYTRWLYKYMRETMLPKILEQTVLLEPLDTQGYIDQIPDAKKRKRYQETHERMKYDNTIDPSLTIIQKSFEAQYKGKNDVRGRIILSPSDSLVLTSGVVNHYFLRCLKAAYPQFVSGLNFSETADRLHELFKDIKDPIYLSMDKKEYDASQHDWMFKAIDHVIMKELIPIVGHKIGWAQEIIDQLSKIIVKTNFKVKLYYKGTRKLLFTAIFIGMTLSGISTQTTGGNSIRNMVECERIIELLAKMNKMTVKQMKKQIDNANHGDDTGACVNKLYLSQLMQIYNSLYTPSATDLPHGYAQRMEEILISTFYMNFCSKDMIFTPDQVLIARQADRALLSGNLTVKLNKNLKPSEFNHVITTQLEKGHSQHPIIKGVIKERRRLLAHKQVKVSQINGKNFDYNTINNMNANDKYDTIQDCELYDQYLSYIAAPIYELNWDNYTIDEVLPNINYKHHDVQQDQQLIMTHLIDKGEATVRGSNIPFYTANMKNEVEETEQMQATNTKRGARRAAPYKNQDKYVKEQVERALQEYQKKKSTEDYIQGLEKKLLDIQQSKSETKDKSPEDLIQMFKQNNQETKELLAKIHKTVNPLYDMSTGQIKKEIDPSMTWEKRQEIDSYGFQALQDIGAFKAGGVIDKYGRIVDQEQFNQGPTPEMFQEFNKQVNKLKEKYPDMTKSQLREIIVLDDWKLIGQRAMGLIGQYGMPVLMSLAQELLPKFQQWIGSQSVQGNLQGQQSYLPKIQGMTDYDQSWQTHKTSNYAKVDSEALACYIAPQAVRAKIPVLNPRKVSISGVTQTSSIIVNASGNAIVRVCPSSVNNFCLGAGSATTNIEAGTNGASWNQNLIRPYSTESSIEQLRVSAMVLNVRVTCGRDQNGSVEMCYTRRNINNNSTAQDTYPITRAQMPSSTYYIAGNATSDYRMIVPFNEFTELFADKAAEQAGVVETPIVQIIFAGFTGQAQGSVIAQLDITTMFEIIPTVSARALYNPSYPSNTPRTREMIVGILVNHPWVQSLSNQNSILLANQLMEVDFRTPEDVDELLDKFRRDNIGSYVAGTVKPLIDDTWEIHHMKINCIVQAEQCWIVDDDPTIYLEAIQNEYDWNQMQLRYTLVPFNSLKYVESSDLVWRDLPDDYTKQEVKEYVDRLYNKMLQAGINESKMIEAIINQFLRYTQSGALVRQYLPPTN